MTAKVDSEFVSISGVKTSKGKSIPAEEGMVARWLYSISNFVNSSSLSHEEKMANRQIIEMYFLIIIQGFMHNNEVSP
ncbi:hypothetical protein MARI151_20319 [Maribacter litoralis]|uniref:Uncharacterized protein n=1 Tax=Maribacter litoralis TaxID=2059726 RepID=A0A653PQL1_9FLAO|nr:hypothetical protein MARI151_20319 [Maribacter litoralis]